jgi:ATP-dependent DNA helicase RecG
MKLSMLLLPLQITNGGELYLGVEDSGVITGLHSDHKDPAQLAAFVANRTVPPVTVRCVIIEYDSPVLKISVNCNQTIKPEPIGLFLPACAGCASIADLDAVERERLRNIIRTYHGEQNLLELTDEELDKRCN